MAEANSLRYRGYYYDRETGFYYLNSRYYDPKTGRFINANSYVSTGQGIVGYNMFAYCGNNPVSREDAEGRFWDTFFDIFSLGVSIYDVFTDPTDGWAWAGLVGDAVDLIPFVTGVGEGTKALGVVNKVDNVHDAAKTTNKTEDMLDLVDGACFVAGTLVLTATGYVCIEDICEGEIVWSENPETGEKEFKKVVQTFERETKELVHVFVDGEEIIATPNHPFYVMDEGWIESIQLQIGDILILQSGERMPVELVWYEILETPIVVYNFEVEDFHTYYVAKCAVLVHNACGMRNTPDQEALIKIAKEAKKQV